MLHISRLVLLGTHRRRALSGIAAALALASLAQGLAQADPNAASLTGVVRDEAGQLLIGATVATIPAGGGTVTDVDGTYALTLTPAVDSLAFGYVGYATVTRAVSDLRAGGGEVVLPLRSLEVVTVTGRSAGNFTSALDPRHVESITSAELKKAPCCNLGESFETNAAVDVSYRDPATGAREMQVLGLRGVYSQLLLEKRPTLYGLAAPIALDLVAGTWLDGIQIGKGAASVQTGPNALAGQVNTELQKPLDAAAPLFVNVFAGGFGRVEANVHTAWRHTDRQATGLLVHSSVNPQSHDRDGDGFYEQPGRQTYSALARHFYRSGDWVGQANLWATRDRREGGQTEHAGGGEHGAHHGGDGRYVIAQANDRLEAFAKTGYLGFARAATSVGVIASATVHELENAYGPVAHRGTQRSGYASALFQSYLVTTDHQYTVGLSYRDDDYRERLGDRDYDRRERVGGAFAEYTYDYTRGTPTGVGLYGVSVIAGLRVDRHSVGGWQALPRVNLKVNTSEATALRASIGRAYRSPQVIAENLRLLPSSRTFAITGTEPLGLESGWNYGVAASHSFELPRGRGGFAPSGQLTLDAYVTSFERVAVVDQDLTVSFTNVYASEAPARTRALLASARVEVARGLEVKLAGKWVDARQTYADGVSRQLPYVPRYRGLASVGYELPSKRWRLHTHAQLVGPQRLPGEASFGLLDVRPAEPLLFESPAFTLLSAQATFVANDRWEVYAGGENLTGYRQTRAILGAANDGPAYFDASRVYAPLMGAMPYAGLRFTLAN